MSSTSSIYGNAEAYPTREDATPRPVSPYGVTKLACESPRPNVRRMLRARDRCPPLLHRLRPEAAPRHGVRKDHLGVARRACRSRCLGTGEQSRDFTYVDDAVSATVAAMERGSSGIVYNVGGGSETTLNDAIALCEELSGRRLQVVHEAVARGDVRRTGADTSLIRSQLGWRPETPLAEGLAAQVAAARAAIETAA